LYRSRFAFKQQFGTVNQAKACSLTKASTPFFGIGAMRAGTTWLAKRLEAYPDCVVMPIKEMHFFDVKYGKFSGAEYYAQVLKNLALATDNVITRATAALEKLQISGSVGHPELEDDDVRQNFLPLTDELRTEFFVQARIENDLRRIAAIRDYLRIRDTNSYVAYLKRHGSGAAAFGEITPAYALLPDAAFAEMDRLLPGACFIFIMRDPVDRLWSQVRYRTLHFLRRDKVKPGTDRADPNLELRRLLRRPRLNLRSGYQQTIESLEAVIPADRILYLFYETMTSPETGPAEIRRIESCLGLEPIEGNEKIFGKVVNSSPSTELDPENEAEAVKIFESTYEFVNRQFGTIHGWRCPSRTPI
jgi:hypothetical protein